MKYSYSTVKIFLLVLCALPILLVAQPSDNSPYSRFGLGDLQNRQFNYLESMGSLGAAYTNNYFINTVNPASYSALRVTAFDIGVHAEYSLLDDGIKQGLWSGNISHISLAFPLQNLINDALERIERKYKLAMGISLIPYTTVGYNISTQEIDPDIGNYTRNFQGSGGTYQLLYGTSVNYKDISFGVHLGYLFGKIEYERNVFFQDLESVFNNNFSNSYSVSGFLWNMGLIYSKTLNESKLDDEKISVRPKTLNFGLYGNAKSNFNTNRDFVEESIQQVFGFNFSRDTLNSGSDILGKGTLPAEFGVGVVYQNGERFAIGADYSYTTWADYTNDAQPDELDNSYKVSIGGFFRPDYKSYNSYFERIIYRYGVFYQTDPRSIGEDRITNYGVSVGFGLPFSQQRKISYGNFGVVMGNRGSNTPIKETYFKFSFSFTYNDDEWFIKRKYN